MGIRSDGRTERPILFTSQEVASVRTGHKVETLRPMSPQPWREGARHALWWSRLRHGKVGTLDGSIPEDWLEQCPYGKAGDLLWVRETWGTIDGGQRYVYRADEGWAANAPESKEMLDGNCWRPSIHMPREASRLLLLLTHVDVRRVHDVTEEGARRAGFEPAPAHGRWAGPREEGKHWSARKALYDAWVQSYPSGRRSWDANPYIWVLRHTVEESL